jgi:hypothetical protein
MTTYTGNISPADSGTLSSTAPHRYVPSAVRFRCEVCSRPPSEHAYRAELRRWREERDRAPADRDDEEVR